jgi:hypothetical protein
MIWEIKEEKMATRAELKERAKNLLNGNYWGCVLAALILSLVGGITGYSGGSTSVNTKYTPQAYQEYFRDISNAKTSQDYIKAFEKLNNSGNNSSLNSIFNDSSDSTYSDSDSSNVFEDLDDSAYSDLEMEQALTNSSSGAMGAIFIVVIIIVIIVLVIAFALAAFLFNPLTVGGKKWVLLNRTSKPDIGVFGYAFSNSYWNVVKVSFIRDIKVFLWTLLFIIPGVIKSYEYRMIPYLLAENPSMSSIEAFEISRNLMTGNKWRAFVLDLSFILWGFLGAIPVIGLFARIFYIYPYVELTQGEFYVQLCAETGQVVQKQNVDFGDSWS